jgi:type I restriction enzyme, S subunit
MKDFNKKGWPLVRLGEHADLLSGFAFKSSQFTDNSDDIHLVKGADVQQGFIDWSGCKRWPKSDLEKYAKFRCKEGDVILAMDRPWVPAGLKWGWIKRGDPDCLLVQRVTRLRGRGILLSDYLRYVIGSEVFANYIKPIVTGVNVPHISGKQISDFTFHIPQPSSQRRIADILSAYDDLIENNQRRIQILENMARSLYREWFVEFRFPGHENVKFVDSPLGKIPENWSCGVINDFLALKSGFAFKSSSFEENGQYGLATIKNVQDGTFLPTFTSRINQLPQKMPDYCFLRTGDILLSLTGNIGRVCFVYGENCLLNQRVAKLVPHNKQNRAYTYLNFRQGDLQNRLMQIANGVAQQNLSPVETGRLEVVLPAAEILALFAEKCEPIIDYILVLFRNNQNLRRTRDLLLPRLLSGQLDVSTLPEETIP